MADIRGLITGDPQADRLVPPSGQGAWLTILASAAMAFLAVLALALSATSGRIASEWSRDLDHVATIRIPASPDDRSERVAAALAVVSQTAGVADARVLSPEEQAALLEPWFGANPPLDHLPVPQLIAVTASQPGYDAQALQASLQAAVPGALLDTHDRWQGHLADAARSLRRLALAALLVSVGALVAIVTLAAQASLATHSLLIDVLRLVGATDGYIARAFVRRFALRTLIGATGGALVGAVALLLYPGSAQTGGLLTGLGFRGAQWLLPIAIPPLAAVVALVATLAATRRQLKDLV